MCLAALFIGRSERFPFVLASNRDEFFARASQPLAWWLPAPAASPILSGRDLAGGGTWMGVNAAGRLALVTNVREPGRSLEGSPSRGALVVQCLADPRADLVELARLPRNGFNLLTVDLGLAIAPEPGTAVGEWVSNRPTVQQRSIGAGAFGLSNASLDTPWPKVSQLKQRLALAIDRCGRQDRHDRDSGLDGLFDAAFSALLDPQPAADGELPQTGIARDRERQLSSAFIHIRDGEGRDGRAYGTRCSTVVVVEARAGRHTVHVVERTHDASGRPAGLQREGLDLPARQ